MYLLNKESHGSLFFFLSQQTIWSICKVSQNKNPKELFSVKWVFSILFSFFLVPRASCPFLLLLYIPVEARPPNQHTQARQEATRATGPSGLWGITHHPVCLQRSARTGRCCGRGNTFQLTLCPREKSRQDEGCQGQLDWQRQLGP